MTTAILLAPLFGDFDFLSLGVWITLGILFTLFVIDERKGGVR